MYTEDRSLSSPVKFQQGVLICSVGMNFTLRAESSSIFLDLSRKIEEDTARRVYELTLIDQN